MRMLGRDSWPLWLVIIVVLFGQIGVFYLYALRCAYDFRMQISEPNSSTDLRMVIVSDIHLLGKRRRTWIERQWVDWQGYISALAAVAIHQPDLVMVLGDQLDEGGLPTSYSNWEEYIARFFRTFSSFQSIKTIYMVGNHDASFGRFMQTDEIKRYEVAFGPSNSVEFVQGHVIIRLNTMALDADVSNEEVKAQARNFLDGIDFEQLGSQTTGSILLLTHLPLFRADDMLCGEGRISESGHVTYEHPSFKYNTHHHVLSQTLSDELIAKIRPKFVFSGHTHAWCEYNHSPDLVEYTIPTFSWGQRPDPSYALVRLRRQVQNREHAVDQLQVRRCSLPRESHIFLLYLVSSVVVAIVSVRRWVVSKKWLGGSQLKSE